MIDTQLKNNDGKRKTSDLWKITIAIYDIEIAERVFMDSPWIDEINLLDRNTGETLVTFTGFGGVEQYLKERLQ